MPDVGQLRPRLVASEPIARPSTTRSLFRVVSVLCSSIGRSEHNVHHGWLVNM